MEITRKVLLLSLLNSMIFFESFVFMKEGDEKHFPPRRRVNSLLIISKSFYEVLPLHHEIKI